MLKYEKNESEKKNAKQKAFDYCMYMMLTSYFASARCCSRQVETQLFLYYKDIKDKEEYEMEVQCIRLIESEILPNIPQRYLKRKAVVRLIKNEKSSITEIVIHTRNYFLLVKCPYKSRNATVIMKQYFRKK